MWDPLPRLTCLHDTQPFPEAPQLLSVTDGSQHNWRLVTSFWVRGHHHRGFLTAVAASHHFCPSLCTIFTEHLSLNPGWPELSLGALVANQGWSRMTRHPRSPAPELGPGPSAGLTCSPYPRNPHSTAGRLIHITPHIRGEDALPHGAPDPS